MNSIKFVEDIAERGCVPDGESYTICCLKNCASRLIFRWLGDNQNLKLEAVTTLFEVMVVHLQQIQRSLNKDGWVVLKICLKQRAYGEKERPKREPKHYNNMRKWQNGEMDNV
ncbi:hypothetical protein YC2023_040009 [Brassica napus]